MNLTFCKPGCVVLIYASYIIYAKMYATSMLILHSICQDNHGRERQLKL